MLLRFAAGNHRSIMEPVELSMIAIDNDRPAARGFDTLHEKVLAVAAIYGPNASGKSNVLDALGWLSDAVDRSLRYWDEYIPRDPFRFADGPSSPSIYEIDLMVKSVRYCYTLELDDQHVISETLTSYPERRERTLLERDDMNVRLRRGINAGGVKELLTPTSLALSAAMRLDIDEIEPFGRTLTAMRTIGLRSSRSREAKAFIPSSVRRVSSLTERIFLDPYDNLQPTLFDETDIDPTLVSRSQAALSLLKYADLGIDDVEIAEGVLTSRQELRRLVRLVHRAADQRIAFDLSDESEGTQTWFRLIGPVLESVRRGQTLIVDELDASLHPSLSAILIELFQDPDSNPRGAQLIFTTHDASLLNHLNRDEVWITEKSQHAETRLTALAEFGGDKVRRSLNLERAYLQGRFGGLPLTDQQLMRQAIGLVTDLGGSDAE